MAAAALTPVPAIPVPECRRRFAAADHAYLATAGDDRRPHIVPVVVAVRGDRVVLAVDGKPKRTTRLRRLRNIEQNPAVALLADRYDPDWRRLWWVRADAAARVVLEGPDRDEALDLLATRHEQYRRDRPPGPVVLADVRRWSGWSASAVPEQA